MCFLPPYSPDLMPAEGIFSQVKSLLKQNHELFHFGPTCLLGFGIWNDYPRGLQWSHYKLSYVTIIIITHNIIVKKSKSRVFCVLNNYFLNFFNMFKIASHSLAYSASVNNSDSFKLLRSASCL